MNSETVVAWRWSVEWYDITFSASFRPRARHEAGGAAPPTPPGGGEDDGAVQKLDRVKGGGGVQGL